MTDILVVDDEPDIRTLIGDILEDEGHGVRMAGDLLDALNASVGSMLKAAVGRTKANGRGTVRPQDL